MHIGFLTSEYPHPKVQHAAGIGTSIKNLVEALHKTGVQVSVFVYGQQHDEVLQENGIKIHLLAQRSYPFLGWYRYRKFLQHYLNRAIASDRIDLIEAPDWTGITAFMRLKAPLVIRMHGSDAYFCYLEKRPQKPKNYWFEKLALHRATAYIAPTDFAAQVTRTIFGLRKTIRTIAYGLSLDRFQNNTPALYQRGMILYIGTLIRKKGVLELPDIFTHVAAQYPGAQLILIGSDAFDKQTQSPSTWSLVQRALPAEISAQVNYLGAIPYAEVQSYIQKAHVCIFPTFAETLGMVTIESMALQKAVVNSNIGWAKEIIDDGQNGFLVHPQNHDFFAERILSLLEQPELCLEIGRQARLKVEEKFDIEKKVIENIDFYREILHRKK